MNVTLKLQAGASEDYVARSIGHMSFGITLRHYVDPTVEAAVGAQRVDAALARVTSGSASTAGPQESVQALLRSLSSAERAALLQTLLAEHRPQ